MQSLKHFIIVSDPPRRIAEYQGDSREAIFVLSWAFSPSIWLWFPEASLVSGLARIRFYVPLVDIIVAQAACTTGSEQQGRNEESPHRFERNSSSQMRQAIDMDYMEII
jgi:hypothetical protein